MRQVQDEGEEEEHRRSLDGVAGQRESTSHGGTLVDVWLAVAGKSGRQAVNKNVAVFGGAGGGCG